ncbi:MoaA/NifB/PqqE/SkfB family radical SAM enzyme [Paucimonas lemoignei]|uniref:MoaA/NifB/PqqE/SkfB family radical SAM enzyme n=1 Tax=Paucimonas lemoignei TaxID=29443 RepID=A0A4R3HW79_PAULE|nr:radical SAM protein [Paucimonas lemoignei]TCS35629.1 MoaA/NifB/PqqE/SkfB family radical SAM enzyme [Paucimonas lemoignei]
MIVVWRITERCNLACGFCAYDRRLPFARRDVAADQVERFAPILADYQKTSGDKVLLSWIGGEPLLWKPFFGLSKWLNNTLGIAVSTTTNGTTLHLQQTRDGILEQLTELTVSVDGLAPFHDDVRNWQGGWERLRASIIALARQRDATQSRLKLRANVVLMHDNLGQFEALCDELASWGIDEITFNQLGGRDRPEFFSAHRLTRTDAEALGRLVPALQKRLVSRGIRLCASPSYLERIESSAADRPLPVSDCSPGQRFLFIDEKGLLSPCNFTAAEFGVPLQEIRNVSDLLALPQIFSSRQKHCRPAVCQDCPSTQVFAKFAS